MRIFVLGLDRIAPESLLGDDRLVRVQHLMEAGLFGLVSDGTPASWSPLLGSTVRDAFERAGRRTRAVLGVDAARASLGVDDWDLLMARAEGPERPEEASGFDATLGGLLELMPEGGAILVAATGGAFLLAGAEVPAVGEVKGASPSDLAATVLALAGLEISPEIGGRPLALPAGPGDGVDAEAEVLERLRGLGYI